MATGTIQSAIRSESADIAPVSEAVSSFLRAYLEFTSSQPAVSTQAHIAAQVRLLDGFMLSITTAFNDWSLWRGLLRRRYHAVLRREVESAFILYGRHRWYAENAVGGHEEISKLRLECDVLDASLETLKELLWQARSNRSALLREISSGAI